MLPSGYESLRGIANYEQKTSFLPKVLKSRAYNNELKEKISKQKSLERIFGPKENVWFTFLFLYFRRQTSNIGRCSLTFMT